MESESGVERLVFFSDAVVAIAITLLALELPVPDLDPGSTTNRDVLHQFAINRDHYLAFGISFIVIARSWTGHHHLFGYVRSLAPGLMRWNLAWLLMIVITPFATRVLTGNGGFQTRFILYAAVQALTGIFFALILRSVAEGGALKENTPPDLVPSSYRRLLTFAVGFLVSIPVAFVTHWAYALWAVVPMLGTAALRALARRASRPAADSLG